MHLSWFHNLFKLHAAPLICQLKKKQCIPHIYASSADFKAGCKNSIILSLQMWDFDITQWPFQVKGSDTRSRIWGWAWVFAFTIATHCLSGGLLWKILKSVNAVWGTCDAFYIWAVVGWNIHSKKCTKDGSPVDLMMAKYVYRSTAFPYIMLSSTCIQVGPKCYYCFSCLWFHPSSIASYSALIQGIKIWWKFLKSRWSITFLTLLEYGARLTGLKKYSPMKVALWLHVVLLQKVAVIVILKKVINIEVHRKMQTHALNLFRTHFPLL